MIIPIIAIIVAIMPVIRLLITIAINIANALAVINPIEAYSRCLRLNRPLSLLICLLS